MIINAFKNKLFPFYSGNYYEESEKESSEIEIEILILVLLNKLLCWTNFMALI